ncbi:MAG: SIS domain-containing protein [[Clostridium] leptum]
MNRTEIILQQLYQDVPALLPLKEKIYQACALMIHCYENNGQILLCGNGGSAADAEHIVGELMKGFLLRRPLPPAEKERFENEGVPELADQLQQALPAISLVSQSALCTCICKRHSCRPGLCPAGLRLWKGPRVSADCSEHLRQCAKRRQRRAYCT